MRIEYENIDHVVNDDKSQIANDETLQSFSKKDAKWDTTKNNAVSFQQIFANSSQITNHRFSERMETCANNLNFSYVINEDTGEFQLKLKSAFFCHVRHCPICDWRRSLRAQAMFKNAIPKIMEESPNSRWIFLTLTVPNCHISELRQTISDMNKAWIKMLKRKGLSFINGWVRKVEVTQEQKRKDYAHPHFHCVLQVNESYFTSRDYLSKMDWVAYWSHAMKSDIQLNVDVRALRKKFDANDIAITELLKTFNYSVKSENIIDDKFTTDWFLEYVEQVRALKFLTSGGTLKNIFKDIRENETDADLVNVDDNGVPVADDIQNPEFVFSFKHAKKQYVKRKDMKLGGSL